MPLFTIICRVPDKLLLVESMETDENSGDLEKYRKKGRKLFHSMTPNTEPSGIINADNYYFMYLLDNDICYLTFCDKVYPKKLAYQFLTEVKDEFNVEHGTEVKQKRLRPFHFEKFDNFIQKTKKLYKDTKSARNLNTVSSDLKDINKLLQQNIDDILERGVKIEGLGRQAEDLVVQTKKFEEQSKELVWRQLLRKWGFVGLFVAFLVFVVLFLYWY